MNFLLELSAFAVISLAAKQIGEYFQKIKLPLISGYLVAGVVVGPFILKIIPMKPGELII